MRTHSHVLAGASLLLLAAAAAAVADDPFAGLAAPPPAGAAPPAPPGWSDNLLLRRELYLLGGATRDDLDTPRDVLSRHSAGFELQKRLATATRTVASLDYQGRLVYRAEPRDLTADPMARDASRWAYETHNAYLDLYQVAGPPGRANLRLGHFYPPFGLNQQTDTHGTLLQLSNDAVLGGERDWQAALYGSLGDDLDYQAGYLLGGGHDWRTDGQSGLAVARLALSTAWLFERGLEGGVSFAAGERVDEHAVTRSPAVASATQGRALVSGWRAGLDLRQRVDSTAGPFSLAVELAAGEDESDPLLSGLAQADWLNPGRRWGAALQYRHFRQDLTGQAPHAVDERLAAVLTRYLRHDVGNASLHWIALGLEKPLRLAGDGHGMDDALMLVQYYRYW